MRIPILIVTFVLQGGKQTKCTLPEVLGNGTLDLRVHGETEIFAQTLKNCGDEKEAEGDRKQTSQHHRVSCLLIRFYQLCNVLRINTNELVLLRLFCSVCPQEKHKEGKTI